MRNGGSWVEDWGRGGGGERGAGALCILCSFLVYFAFPVPTGWMWAIGQLRSNRLGRFLFSFWLENKGGNCVRASTYIHNLEGL